MAILLHNPEAKSSAGFIAKNNIIYKVKNAVYVDARAVHEGYLKINEDCRAKGDKRQVVNFGGRIGGYLIPLK